jgi:hypothetical protein
MVAVLSVYLSVSGLVASMVAVSVVAAVAAVAAVTAVTASTCARVRDGLVQSHPKEHHPNPKEPQLEQRTLMTLAPQIPP